MSPAIWLFSWLSFQVPTKGFCAAAVVTAAMQVNQPSTANSNGLVLIWGISLALGWTEPKAGWYSNAEAPMSLEHFCCLVAFCIGENPNSKLFVYQGHGFCGLFSP
jgi:hypothetical protein